MLKRSAIFKALLIGILAIVFLLMLSGTAKAEVVWEINQDIIDIDNFIWWNDTKGDKYTGTYAGISWEAIILEEDSILEGSPGKVSFRITNVSGNKTVTIPDKIHIPSNTLTNWHEYSYEVTDLVSNSFNNCSGVTNIKIGKYIKNIHVSAFEGCTGLTKITVDKGNSNFTDIDGVLYNKNKTTLVKYPIAKSTANFNIPTTVTKIGDYAFSKNVTTEATIKLPTSVTSIGNYAFYNFKGLKSIEIPATVNNIGTYAFSGCSILEKVNLPQAVTKVSAGVFKDCIALKEVILGNQVTSIGNYAFYGTEELSYIKLPATLTSIGTYAFAKCNSFKEIEIPDSVTTIGESAFANCTSLNKVTLPSNLNMINNALFYGCTSLTDVNIPNKITSIGINSFYNTKISRVEVPETVTKISGSAFKNCADLISVVVPASITTVGTTIFDGANSNLVVYATENNKVIPLAPAYIIYEKGTDSVNLKSFTDIKGNVVQIDLLNKIYGLPVTVIGASAFKDNTKLTKITIPDTVTSIEAEAFSGCTGLTEMFLPKTLKTIGNKAFYNCTGLKTIIVPKGTPIESIGEVTEEDGETKTNAFTNCSAIIYHDGTNAKMGELASININVKIDNEAPTVEYRGWGLASNKEYATITLKGISDVGSGAYKYAISDKENVDELKDEEWILIGDTTEVIAEVKTNGNKYIYIMDKVGNVNKNSQFISGVDVTKPQIQDITDENITGSVSGAQIKIIVTDEPGGSGLSSYLISQIKESEIGKVTTGWKTISGTTSTITDVISNIGTWFIYVKDNAGNIGVKQIVIDSKYIDKVAPSITIKTKEPQLNEQNKIAYEILNATLTDEGIGLAGYAIDTKETVNESTEWINIDGKTYELSEPIEVNGTYYIHAKDVYGNVENLKFETIQIEGDFIAPKVEFGSKAADDKVEVTLFDTNSGLATGANIGYAWSTSDTEEPENFETATLTYANGDNKVSFKVDGNSLTGTYYLWIKVGTLKDVKGNECVQGIVKPLPSYIFDNTLPTIKETTLNKDVIKENGIATYTIITSEEVTLNSEIKPYITNDKFVQDANLGTLGEIIGSGNTWTVTFTAGKSEGTVVLVLPKGIFKDTAGNEIEEIKITKLKVDNTGSEFDTNSSSGATSGVKLSKAKIKNGVEAIFTFTTNEKLTIVEAQKASVTLTGEGITGTVIDIRETVDGNTWTFTVKGGEGNGAVTLNLPKGLFIDEAGNESKEQKILGLSFDNTAPTITIEGPEPALINKDKTSVYTIKVSEKVDLVNESGIAVSGAKVEFTKKAEDGTVWEVKVSNATGDGEAKLVIAEGTFKDVAGNTSVLTEKAGLTIDNTAPNIVSVSEPTYSNDKESANIVITTDKKEAKYVVSTSDSVESVTEEWKTANSATMTATVESNGEYYVYVIDEAGNIGKYTNAIEVTEIIDNIAPSIKIEAPKPSRIRTGEKATFKISTSEAVTVAEGFKAEVTGEGNIVELTGSNTNWVATVTAGSEDGEVELVLPKGIFKDTSDNSSLEEVTKSGLIIDNKAPEATVKYEQIENGIKVSIIANEELSNLEGWTLTKTNKDNDTLVKEFTDDLSEVTVKDIVGNEAKVETKVKFATDIKLVSEETIDINASKKLALTTIPTDVTAESIKWTSSDTSKVTVDKDGKIKGIATGTATITAMSVIDSNIKDTCEVTVTENVYVELKGIAFEKSSVQIVEGSSETLKVKFTPSNAINQKVTFTSNDETVATVDSNGKVTALKLGKTTITATAEEGGYVATCDVTVIEPVPVEKIELDLSTVDLYIGDSKTIVATVLPETATDKSLEWSSSNEKVATVNKNGKITAVGVGTATITVMSKADGIIEECEVKVAEFIEVENVTLSQTNVDIMKNSDIILVATINPSNATNKKVTWKSNDETVAKVVETEPGYAKVTGLKEGTATITVITEDGNKTNTCKVKVTNENENDNRVKQIKLSNKEITLPIGGIPSKISATIIPEDLNYYEIKWSSSDDRVATVDSKGNITAIDKGTAIITASAIDGKLSAKCTVTVVEAAIGFNEEAQFGMETIDGIQYLVGINPKTAIQSILDKVAEGYTATVENANGAEITDFTKYASTDNTRIIVTNGTETITYIVIIKGDCTGDGLVTSLDLIGAVRQYKYVKSEGTKGKNLTGAKLLAIKFTETKDYAALDLIGEVRMYKQWKINN